MHKALLLPAILILAAIGTGAYWYLVVRPAQIDIPEQSTLFAPDSCGFKVRMAGSPATRRQMRGELPVEIATLQLPNSGAVKVSCGPYIVLDEQAFESHLLKQMQRAAKIAGLKQVETQVTREGNGLSAYYEGVKGEAELAVVIRSETRVERQHFVEILHVMPAAKFNAANRSRLARIEP